MAFNGTILPESEDNKKAILDLLDKINQLLVIIEDLEARIEILEVP